MQCTFSATNRNKKNSFRRNENKSREDQGLQGTFVPFTDDRVSHTEEIDRTSAGDYAFCNLSSYPYSCMYALCGKYNSYFLSGDHLAFLHVTQSDFRFLMSSVHFTVYPIAEDPKQNGSR